MTIQTVKTVEVGEEEIKALGFRQFRVRFHGELVRIEVARDEMERALQLDMAAKFTAIFKKLGFKYVTLDLEGYRQVSVEIWTHAAGGLTENDFILAAKINQIPIELKR